MEYAIETEGLTKYYGSVRGIEDVALKVRPGEVFGFLGPNGAGKTTTIRLLLNLLHPTRGSARVLGMDVQRQSLEVRRRCGVVSGEPAFYDSLSGTAHVELVQSFHGDARARRIGELAERLDLDLSRPVRSYSHGMRQKLAIVQAMAHDPELLILDEPTAGLDPLVQHEFYRMLDEERGRGKAVFLSSHILSEVERVCDGVGIVREGRLVAVLDVADLKLHRVRRMEVFLGREAVAGDFQVEGVEVVRCEGNRADLLVSGHVGELVRCLAALPVEDVVFPEATLEDTFMQFYSDESEDAA
jgi:ABC-2 type transport system ATP-binding protein